ncbi:Ferredoxin-dependent glutamate synthase 1 [uncultured Desulfatiglans sp.]|uniref:Glutamate synthase [NADPH] large chain n=1 Tax=Uncultured Desulfatiglans sp. TaxID=1748965 RepID=A0A653A5F4_UNCDX|nr:Ferredoxin-dependent glutamate synthase 1 [uncultured Desulfatiglans sp.]
MSNGRTFSGFPAPQGLYDPACEHDSCGVGFVVNIDGRPDHGIVEKGIRVLKNLEHRGAIGGDLTTGDGAGILFQLPDGFFRQRCSDLGIVLPQCGSYGVGMFFLPPEADVRERLMEMAERKIVHEGLRFLGWRAVPVQSGSIAGQARAQQPCIMQCFAAGEASDPAALDRRLYLVRREMEQAASEWPGDESVFYVPSFSCRTIVYKGLLTGPQLPLFYPDLLEEDLVSALAVIHQRYSTNTFPSWELAQPFRHLAHNGEINTLRGNLNLWRSRESSFRSPLFGNDIKRLLPVIDPRGSDSACLDNALEFLYKCGRSLPHAMLMLIPEAWGTKYPLGPDQKGFFEYHAGLMEPWDGPAAVAFSDGSQVGAMLDRNGLRPARYTITRDGFMAFASEAGVLDFDPGEIAEKGALRPGQMILADFAKKRVLKNGEIKTLAARAQPYRRWVEENRIAVRGFYGTVSPVKPDRETLLYRQKRFGYTREDIHTLMGFMAAKGQEPVGSMGADSPLAVFSEKPQLLYNYFKQLFAQVTNPAIDPVREELVMSLMTFIGNPGNILQEVPQNAHLIKLQHPILANEDLQRIRDLQVGRFQAVTIPIGFPAGGSGKVLEMALEALCDRCAEAIRHGTSLLILSDRGLCGDDVPIPALLAASAVNRCLVEKGLRTGAGLILETGEAREVMHMALLLGYGATAVNPYLAFETVADLSLRGQLEAPVGVSVALDNYIKALCKGLLKIMSKMGIAVLRSYRSAQVFEAVGIDAAVVDRYFTGTASRVGGIGMDEIAEEANARHRAAHEADRVIPILPSGGFYKLRLDGERHLLAPGAITALQRAVREDDSAFYREYAALINEQNERVCTLRGMFRFRETPEPVPVSEVEPVEAIVRRFVTGAMSFGSISREAHEAIAIAMNRLGAMSNSGEGGEDPARYQPLPNGDSRSSAVKQVASGRFGVTAEYLVNAREIQIKVAQGAKPGEGGQLPGHKVNAEIARVRYSTPGVTLISPPPHHDIYSIEDLSQLIFDLKNVNPRARISVKLVSEIGVGTVAAGVAKAHADMVLISGYDGGTGASPLSSIRHAGAPWELGLADTQQTLVLNGLRGRIRVQTDGQMKTGRDVVIAALLGAEEYGFATIALVVMGCVMMRKCHNNTCPVGIATQDPELRRRFAGRPEHLTRYFTFLAEEVREYMARLGFRTMDEMIGRSDLLDMNHAMGFWKARGLDFSRIFYRPPDDGTTAYRCVEAQKHPIEDVLDRRLIAECAPALEQGQPVALNLPIRNVDRTAGAMLSGEIAGRYGNAGLPEDTIRCRFTGAAGQSFGAFGARGLTLILEGEANDYLGKGLSGGRIIVKPFPGAGFDPSHNIVAGNVILYGATGGEVFIHGRAGERFAIRNSGALAVVEGVGDHGCEYMTGGRVVVLGETGINFAAGMSGGIAYVYDPERRFDHRCNLDMVDLELMVEPEDVRELKRLIERHAEATGSARAAAILEDWEACLPFFVKVFPMEYRRVLGKMTKEDEATEREEVQHG